MPTNNLEIPYIDAGVEGKSTQANTAFDQVDGALSDHDASSLAFPSDANWTPTGATRDACIANISFVITGTITGTKNLVVPDNSKLYLMKNSTTTGSVTVKTSAGSGITIANTDTHLLYCDGTNVVEAADVVGAGGGASPPVALAGYYGGTPAVSSEIWKFVTPITIDFADDFSGSYAHAGTAPSGGSVIFDVKVDGTSIGDFTFASASSTATFTTDATTEQITAGKRLSVETPADLRSMADIAWTFYGTR